MVWALWEKVEAKLVLEEIDVAETLIWEDLVV